MNATQQACIGGRRANGDLTRRFSHEAVCPEEEMRVISRGGIRKGWECVCFCDSLNSGSGTQHWPLNLVMDRVGYGEASRIPDGMTPIHIYLLSRPLDTCVRKRPHPSNCNPVHVQ